MLLLWLVLQTRVNSNVVGDRHLRLGSNALAHLDGRRVSLSLGNGESVSRRYVWHDCVTRYPKNTGAGSSGHRGNTRNTGKLRMDRDAVGQTGSRGGSGHKRRSAGRIG
jgi:hypothetical protein